MTGSHPVKPRGSYRVRISGYFTPRNDKHYQISPTLFYQWEKIADQAARTALQGQAKGRKKLRPREEALLAEVHRLQEVIAELSAENLQLKRGRWR